MNSHSWITLSQSDPRPLYLQIIEQVQRRVAVGDLPSGMELPSIRQMAAELQVSVITVKRAYLELEREGVIETRHGKGSVVAERPGLQTTIQQREYAIICNRPLNWEFCWDYPRLKCKRESPKRLRKLRGLRNDDAAEECFGNGAGSIA